MAKAKGLGSFVWYELMTTDAGAAEAFYRHVLGWGARDAGMVGMSYTLFSAEGADVAGSMALPQEACDAGAGPSWMGYVGVEDVDATAAQAAKAGGTVHRPPMASPASAASPLSPIRRARPSRCSRPLPAARHSPRRPARPGMAAGMSCMRARGNRPSASTPTCSDGPRGTPWIWGRWASTRSSIWTSRCSAA